MLYMHMHARALEEFEKKMRMRMQARVHTHKHIGFIFFLFTSFTFSDQTISPDKRWRLLYPVGRKKESFFNFMNVSGYAVDISTVKIYFGSSDSSQSTS